MSEVLYVYAVTDSFPGSVATGLQDAPLRAIECGPVQAVVSEHAAPPKPNEGLLWAHEQIVEELMEESTILPMRLGSTVEGTEALIPMLERRREEFIASLNRVRGAVELSVRAQLPSVTDPLNIEPITPQAGPGTAYLLKRAQRQRRGEEAAEMIHRPLAALARQSMRKRGGDPRAFKAAYLVDQDVVEAFGERVEQLDGNLGDAKVICTGPWPPYSFVSEEPG
jgi:hypothetical protein